jgi:hypothetical protein
MAGPNVITRRRSGRMIGDKTLTMVLRNSPSIKLRSRRTPLARRVPPAACQRATGASVITSGNPKMIFSAPTGDRTRIGGSGAPLPITGYNIVDANSLDAAKALCENHPFLAGAPADFSVDVYELNPIQM